MRGGLLKHLVSLQQEGSTQDALGQMVPGWPEVQKLWASIGYLSGQQTIRSDAPASLTKVSIQIRRISGVLPSMRIVDAAGTIYRIDSVLPDLVHRDRINLACEVIGG